MKAHAQNLSSLSTYSVVVSGNFSTNSDVEGRTLVGGNLTGTNSANFATQLGGTVDTTDLTLRVGGNISSGNPIQLNAGSLEIGGSTNGRIINYNGGGSQISNPSANYSAIIDELTLASEILSTYGANSNVIIPAEQPSAFKFDAVPDENGLAVFYVDGSDLFSNSYVQQIELIANGATDIIINVSGSTINWQYGNLVGLFTDEYWQSRIVWNFYEAETIDFGSKNMMGQVLAPNASVTTANPIDGSIFAAELTANSEIHLPGYAGSMIPEPTTALLGLVGGLVLLARRKRA
ncbi:choice-of-anchor A family protein [Luteolibacter pohnpeiensis]|uniref:Choice-of-anchor A family protein n=1 Tax=Luteolibacter pohnpeiensis TaxID=454153 RepID=A0A934S8D9_9BACT|nr:choice-of-anchor A family protein [Luteolibacter pohnpeiensis]MBK1881577.1 choice-of-anchor A family protein [Luteolibacter pohnpeiensis]